jgi:chemotaxis response regulator CheB
LARRQKVLLVNGSRFIREILRRVFEKSVDFTVVGEIDYSQNLSTSIRDTTADWVVVSLPPGSKLPDHFKTLMLTEFPKIRVMGISADGSEVRVEWVGIHEKDFRGLTLDGLQKLLITDFNKFEEDHL